MNNQPLISITTAFLNEKRFLSEAIESVLAQTYTNWELFLVDDGSTDESTGIAKEYAAKYPGKIFYCEHEGHANKGLSASRNYAIGLSKGEYLAILDADDVWHADKLKDQLDIMLQYPEAGMVCGTYEYWHSWDAKAKSPDKLVPVGAPQDQLIQPPLMLTYLYPLSYGSAPCPSDIMLRRFVYDKYAKFEGGVFVGDYQFYEDQPFFCKIYFHVPVYVSSKCHLRYRQRAESMVALAHKEGIYDKTRKFFLSWFKQYMEEHGIRNKSVETAYNRSMLPYHTGFAKVYYVVKDKVYKLLYPVIKIVRS